MNNTEQNGSGTDVTSQRIINDPQTAASQRNSKKAEPQNGAQCDAQ